MLTANSDCFPLYFCSYREKPGDIEWIVIQDQKLPFLLNFSQCKLCLKDYYPVIEHTTTVLGRDKGKQQTSKDTLP